MIRRWRQYRGGGSGGAPVGGGRVTVSFELKPAALDNKPLNYATKAGLKKYDPSQG